MSISYPHLDTSKYVFPNADGKNVEEKLQEFADNYGNFDYSGQAWSTTFGSYFSANNWLSYTQALTTLGVGLALGAFSIAFPYTIIASFGVNILFGDLISNKTKSSYNKLLQDIYTDIDEDNIKILSASASGILNTHRDLASYIHYLGDNTETYTQSDIDTIIAKIEAFNTNMLQQLPLFLITDDKDICQGIPIYASTLSIYIEINLEFLSNASALNYSSAGISALYKTLMDNVLSLQASLANAYDTSTSNVGTDWKSVTKFKNGCYTGGMANLALSLRKMIAFTYSRAEKKISLRDSLEIYSSDGFTGYDENFSAVTASLYKRISPMCEFYAGTSPSNDGCISGLKLEFTDGVAGSLFSDEYNGGASENSFCTHVDQYSTIFDTSGSSIPCVVTWVLTNSTDAKDDYIWSDINISNSTGLNKIINNSLSPDEYYTFNPSGYILSGFACQVLFSAMANGASIFRHWTSIESLAVIEDANVGIELDSTCGLILTDGDSSQYTFTPDPLLGKTLINILNSNTLYFNLINNTGASLDVNFVLLCKDDDYNYTVQQLTLNLNSEEVTYIKEEFSQYITGAGGHKYAPAFYGTASLGTGPNSLTLTPRGDYKSNSVVSVLVIPAS